MASQWADDLSGDFRRDDGELLRPKIESSPYYGLDRSEWLEKTRQMLNEHPLDGDSIKRATLSAWDSIFASRIAEFSIGKEIFPAAQIMGFFLHELVPLRLAADFPGWRKDSRASEKDLVYEADPFYSVELKTSSNSKDIFGNRSFGLDNPGRGKKAKDGFYLCINFQSWKGSTGRPGIQKIRFGWIDHTDWNAQRAQTGQNSTLGKHVYNTQLLTLFEG